MTREGVELASVRTRSVLHIEIDEGNVRYSEMKEHRAAKAEIAEIVRTTLARMHSAVEGIRVM
jgi:hypothetical protein